MFIVDQTNSGGMRSGYGVEGGAHPEALKPGFDPFQTVDAFGIMALTWHGKICLMYSRSWTIQASLDLKNIGNCALSSFAGLRHLVSLLVTKHIFVITARDGTDEVGPA